ncbi:cobalt-zinc-cadmium resistance protein CzcA [Marinilabilia salmonicolor]|uniref:CusA/CzcA family heavy metal efflux RND transporter n=1 Tax=Marinilabilia salmonicolor TaxID=989 RepID=UPI000D066CDD|nr:CusA/CzcA family heavy metal efflux RND transporter [Marinilabilia salmonicolor]PRY99762.1 cobalt-zinc-cadmium resistance protein CzcA [Marinilabilia salmonicolor]
MIEAIVRFSVRNKLMVFLFTATVAAFGIFSLTRLPIGATPDVTNNQVQVITTSRNLSTLDVEKFLTYPVEMEMANLPGVQEIRSVSKFGLSVVTIVFDENLGTYLPRQLIAEKIESASEAIPEGYGKPFMGPVSTGLGEIYQYTLEVKPGYEERYSPMELRSIQDWMVKRQLSGIDGVVEVNTWGGLLKQYEVAVDPARLKELDVTLDEVYQAVSENNSVAGGSYIERNGQSYFVRGEGLVQDLDDIRNIVVDSRAGSPVLVRHLAEVQFGRANRFGAITGNGEGEKVMGQVMMLKGANPKAVIDRVKERVAEVQETLPEGVYINPFLDRSELIGRTTATIAENLILGALIVIFVVVLLLGSWRSGLVVASIIPLSLLFALSLMYLTGVDANLMSLGAIDFGIIIDGAVIIVEYISYKINVRRKGLMGLSGEERLHARDSLSIDGASKMMKSAVFGQVIIIIVLVPILTLSGVEGKMFRPMALTFSFALLGAMVFGFTFVPAISALFIKASNRERRTISARLMDFLNRLYAPTIAWSLNHKKAVVIMAAILLGGSGFLFTRMGAEFVPTLDEGDFVIQPVLKTGTSLGETIEIMTRIEKIVKTFPETRQVVSRIGAAEVPTDPMSMEETDVIIALKRKGSWTTAETKDELADKYKERIQEKIPGLEIEFTQPIEMRFNELITGVRADLAIKVFGDDLEVLNQKGDEIQQLMRDIPGAADVVLEKTTGLPEMLVSYNRKKLASLGLNIADINRLINFAFAGASVGTVYEGERRFDLVVRLTQESRNSVEDLHNLMITLPGGSQIPMGEVADISYSKGPAQISRDETRRRIVVGVNVRGRDLESVVEDAADVISRKVDLPPGYFVEYGGQFENLRSARQRLLVVVPVALLLIFIMLHFAFGSIRPAILVFSAVPLSAVGGILFLWMRGMPFSISAGVGFVALFGVSVLNGIVLIDHYHDLRNSGMTDLKELILAGARQRLRPVLLTATSTAFGFFPMAFSTGAGAEVQRPLATVVVGGLVTATLLTLVVLPVLYCLMEDRSKLQKFGIPKWLTILLVLLAPAVLNAQRPVSPEEAVQLALENNAGILASDLKLKAAKKRTSTAWDLDKTEFTASYDENNIAADNTDPITVFGVSQQLKFPLVYMAEKKVLKSGEEVQLYRHRINQRELTRNVLVAYYDVIYFEKIEEHYQALDSLFSVYADAVEMKQQSGEGNRLDVLLARTKNEEVALKLMQASEDRSTAMKRLEGLLQLDEEFTLSLDALPRLDVEESDPSGHPEMLMQNAAGEMAGNEWKVNKMNWLPDISIGYFQGTNDVENTPIYRGFEVGLAFPLFFGSQSAKVKSSRMEMEAARLEYQNFGIQLSGRREALMAQYRKHARTLEIYETNRKAQAGEMMKVARKSFDSGQISVLEYVTIMDQARQVMLDYLNSLRAYNRTVLEINYLVL